MFKVHLNVALYNIQNNKVYLYRTRITRRIDVRHINIDRHINVIYEWIHFHVCDLSIQAARWHGG